MIKITYVVFDLEFNQSSEDKEHRLLNFEILQIGAVKLDEHFNVIDEFNKLIKPSVNLQIHPYVKNLININEYFLNNSDKFPKVFEDFLNFLDNDSILVVWGKEDIKTLFDNINFHNIPCDSLPTTYIDIQNYANKHFNIKKGLKIGLKKAVDLLDIKTSNNFHDAFYDALYTSEILKRLYTPLIKPSIYKHVENNKNETIKATPTTSNYISSLIKEIEKKLQRPINGEEKKIINLTYNLMKKKSKNYSYKKRKAK